MERLLDIFRNGRSAQAQHKGSIAGLVDEMDAVVIAGWVSREPGADPVIVSIVVDGQPIVHTRAVISASFENQPEIQRFRFNVRDLWSFLNHSNILTVEAAGIRLPIVGRGMWATPHNDGSRSLDDLRSLFSKGHVLNSSGRVKLSKRNDKLWQKETHALYWRVNDFLKERFEYEILLCYGSLLGAVREQSYIGHDPDFDACYISRKRNGVEAASELVGIAHALIDAGFTVKCKKSCILIEHEMHGGADVDLFHLFLDENENLCFPFGVAGQGRLVWSEIDRIQDIDVAGKRFRAVSPPEPMVKHIYGENWQIPNPGFDWRKDRTKRARSGILTMEQVADVNSRQKPGPAATVSDVD